MTYKKLYEDSIKQLKQKYPLEDKVQEVCTDYAINHLNVSEVFPRLEQYECDSEDDLLVFWKDEIEEDVYDLLLQDLSDYEKELTR